MRRSLFECLIIISHSESPVNTFFQYFFNFFRVLTFFSSRNEIVNYYTILFKSCQQAFSTILFLYFILLLAIICNKGLICYLFLERQAKTSFSESWANLLLSEKSVSFFCSLKNVVPKVDEPLILCYYI